MGLPKHGSYYFSFLRTLHKLYSGCVHSHQQCTKFSASPHVCQHLLVDIYDKGHPHRCAAVASCGFWISLMIRIPSISLCTCWLFLCWLWRKSVQGFCPFSPLSAGELNQGPSAKLSTVLTLPWCYPPVCPFLKWGYSICYIFLWFVVVSCYWVVGVSAISSILAPCQMWFAEIFFPFHSYLFTLSIVFVSFVWQKPFSLM